MLFQFVLEMSKNYYPQVFLEKQKYKIKAKQIKTYITTSGIKISTDDDNNYSNK